MMQTAVIVSAPGSGQLHRPLSQWLALAVRYYSGKFFAAEFAPCCHIDSILLMSMICHATAPSTICLQEHGCTSQRFSIPYCYVSSLTTGSVYAVINHHHCQCNGCAACWMYTAQHKWQAMLLSWAGTKVGIACQPWLHGTHSAFRDVVSPKWRTFSGSTLINIDAMYMYHAHVSTLLTCARPCILTTCMYFA